MNAVSTALVDHEPSLPMRRDPVEARTMTPMEMVGRALEMGVSADILKQMMDLRDREEARNAKLAFTRAVAAATAVFPEPTSPSSKRIMGCCLPKSVAICSIACCWARVRGKLSRLLKSLTSCLLAGIVKAGLL